MHIITLYNYGEQRSISERKKKKKYREKKKKKTLILDVDGHSSRRPHQGSTRVSQKQEYEPTLGIGLGQFGWL